MSKRIAISTLNASTIDILNVIRANAGLEYQALVPEIASEKDIPRVGEVLLGYPALANQFLNALVNRIALVVVKSAVFNNPYSRLKKGYLNFGETVYEIFVNLTKVREFSVEKAPSREHARTLPDVKSAFHAINWRVQYPVTIQDEELKQAFLSVNGVTDMIARIVKSVYTSAEYDEFLLFKYMMIKAIASGKMFPVSVDTTEFNNTAKSFRAGSNKLTFMSNKYNSAGVTTVTPRENQYIFMDSDFNAQYDVDILSAAFNMDKAEYMGKLLLIDDWGSFDNERFMEISQNTDMIEPVTDEELAITKNVLAVLIDEEWFQIYDNEMKFTEKYVASGMYWNYFLNIWKTVSSSPFSNAIVYVKGDITPLEDTYNVEITEKSIAENATVVTLIPQFDNVGTGTTNLKFIQTQDATTKGIAVHQYGAIIFPPNQTSVDLEFSIGDTYYSGTVTTTENVGDTIIFTKKA